MNKLLITILLINSHNLHCMNTVETKTKAAERQVVYETTVDSLKPDCLPENVWAIITDYSHDTSTEYEAFTYCKKFANIIGYTVSGDAQIIINYPPSSPRSKEYSVYNFQSRTAQDFPFGKHDFHRQKKFARVLAITNATHYDMPVTTISMYTPDETTLISTFAVEPPKRIDHYVELSETQIVFTVTGDDHAQQLIIWNPITSTSEYTAQLSYLISDIIPLTQGRLALIINDQSYIVIKDLKTQKDSFLPLEKKLKSYLGCELYELENGNILSHCNDIVQVSDASTYATLFAIRGCCNSKLLKNKIILQFDDETVKALDPLTFELTPIIDHSDNPNAAPISLAKIDSNAILISLLLPDAPNVYKIYSPDDNNYGSPIQQYLNVTTNQGGYLSWHNGHVFKTIEVRGTLKDSVISTIIWYDFDAVPQMRRLPLKIKQNLKEFLQRLREKRKKLLEADSAEPITLTNEESLFLSSLPPRLQENIMSHVE
jgi:hypothetical protein